MTFNAAWARIRQAARWPVVYLLLLCVLVDVHFTLTPLIGWDEAFYWGQLTSLFHDGDLTLHDDLLANGNDILTQYRTIARANKRGWLQNTFSIGTAVVDGIVAGPVVALHRLADRPRCGPALLRIAAVGAVFKVFVLVLVLQSLLRRLGGDEVRRDLAIASVLVGTPLLLYAAKYYFMSHLNAALLCSLVMLLGWRWMEAPSAGRAAALGLACGFAGLTRFQDLAFGLALVPPFVHGWLRSDRDARLRLAAGGAIVCVVAAGVLAIQCLAWQKQFGGLFVMRHGPTYMKWGQPVLWGVLLSGYRGLLTWSPVVALCLAGLVAGIRRESGFRRWWLVGCLLAAAAMIYVNACTRDWWAGTSYGSRRFCSVAPVFAVGLFALLGGARRRVAAAVLVLALLWAHVTTVCWQTGIEDLAVPFCGRRSQAHRDTPARAGIVNPADARAKLWTGLRKSKIRYARLMDWGRKGPRRSWDEGVSFALIAGAMGLAVLARRLAGDRRWRRGATVACGAYAAGFVVVLAVFVPDSSRLNPVWRAFLDRQADASVALAGGAPEPAVALVDARRMMAAGETAAAMVRISQVASPDYPHLTPAGLEELARRTGAGAAPAGGR